MGNLARMHFFLSLALLYTLVFELTSHICLGAGGKLGTLTSHSANLWTEPSSHGVNRKLSEREKKATASSYNRRLSTQAEKSGVGTIWDNYKESYRGETSKRRIEQFAYGLSDSMPEDACWRRAYVRFPRFPRFCPQGTERGGGSCFPLCQKGYLHKRDGRCIEKCPVGYATLLGGLCARTRSKKRYSSPSRRMRKTESQQLLPADTLTASMEDGAENINGAVSGGADKTLSGIDEVPSGDFTLEADANDDDDRELSEQQWADYLDGGSPSAGQQWGEILDGSSSSLVADENGINDENPETANTTSSISQKASGHILSDNQLLEDGKLGPAGDQHRRLEETADPFSEEALRAEVGSTIEIVTDDLGQVLPQPVCWAGFELRENMCLKFCPEGSQPTRGGGKCKTEGEYWNSSREKRRAPRLCPSGYEKQGKLCYPPCKTGYIRSGNTCIEDCQNTPQGTNQRGKRSSSKNFGRWCYDGFRRDEFQRQAIQAVSCDPNEMVPVLDGKMCFKKCDSGYAMAMGISCWGSCPRETPVSCGLACTRTDQECTELFNEIARDAGMMAFQLTMIAVTAGTAAPAVAGVGAAAGGAHAAATGVATGMAIKATLMQRVQEKFSRDYVAKAVPNMVGTALHAVSNQRGMATDFIQVLDPTGIYLLVKSLSRRMCRIPTEDDFDVSAEEEQLEVDFNDLVFSQRKSR